MGTESDLFSAGKRVAKKGNSLGHSTSTFAWVKNDTPPAQRASNQQHRDLLGRTNALTP